MQPKPKLPAGKPLPGKGPALASGKPAVARPAAKPGAAKPMAARPYGAAAAPVAAGKNKGPRALNFIFLGGAAAMILGFILPWFSISTGTTSLNWGGWELPIQFNKLLGPFIDLADKMLKPGDPGRDDLDAMKTALTSLYAVYLIPILCSAGVVEELISFKKGRNWWWMRAVAAASPIIAFIVVSIAFGALLAQVGGGSGGGADPETTSTATRDGPSVFSVLGFGVYVSFAGFAAAVAGIFIAPKPKEAAAGTAAPTRPARPPMGAPRVRGAASVRMAPSVNHAPTETAEPPAALPQADTVRAPQGEAPEQAPPLTPKRAAIHLLALVASIEPEVAPQRLQKAAIAAGKLLGDSAVAEISTNMAQPVAVHDLPAQVAELAAHVAGNAKLAQGTLKCAIYALKGADGGLSEPAQAAISELEAHFGPLPAPAPAPMPAPPPVYAPAPPPMQAPAGYAPAPPPMQAPGPALPRPRRRPPGYR